jgi:hypothetical protein
LLRTGFDESELTGWRVGHGRDVPDTGTGAVGEGRGAELVLAAGRDARRAL